MAMDFNEFLTSGNLGRGPDHSVTSGGKSMTKFSVACNESYATKDGDRQEKVTWFNIVTFDSLADFCYQYLKKGAFVVIKGKLSIRKYEGRDGTEKTAVEIIASQVRSPGGAKPKNDDSSARDPFPVAREQQRDFGDPGRGSEPTITDSDIPFMSDLLGEDECPISAVLDAVSPSRSRTFIGIDAWLTVVWGNALSVPRRMLRTTIRSVIPRNALTSA